MWLHQVIYHIMPVRCRAQVSKQATGLWVGQGMGVCRISNIFWPLMMAVHMTGQALQMRVARTPCHSSSSVSSELAPAFAARSGVDSPASSSGVDSPASGVVLPLCAMQFPGWL